MTTVADRTRLVTWKEPLVDKAQIAAMSGLDYLRHLLDSERNPPIAALLDFKLVRIEPGRAVFSGTPSAPCTAVSRIPRSNSRSTMFVRCA
jgi:hypothetical protein